MLDIWIQSKRLHWTGPELQNCLNCGKQGHLKKECTEKYFCQLCETEGHNALNWKCKMFKRMISWAKIESRTQEWENEPTPAEEGISKKHKNMTKEKQILQIVPTNAIKIRVYRKKKTDEEEDATKDRKNEQQH